MTIKITEADRAYVSARIQTDLPQSEQERLISAATDYAARRGHNSWQDAFIAIAIHAGSVNDMLNALHRTGKATEFIDRLLANRFPTVTAPKGMRFTISPDHVRGGNC